MLTKALNVTLLTIFTILTTACGQKTKTEYVEVEKKVVTEQNDKKLECASQENFDIAEDRRVQTQEVTLRRIQKRVVRYSCDGQVMSDRLELLPMDNIDIEIFSDKQIIGDLPQIIENLNRISAKAFNRQTCQVTNKPALNINTQVVEKKIYHGGMDAVMRYFEKKVTSHQLKEIRNSRPGIQIELMDKGSSSAKVGSSVKTSQVQLIDYEFNENCSSHNERQGPRYQGRGPSRNNRFNDCQRTFEKGTLVLVLKTNDFISNELEEVYPKKCRR
jgi:hypothetical protein